MGSILKGYSFINMIIDTQGHFHYIPAQIDGVILMSFALNKKKPAFHPCHSLLIILIMLFVLTGCVSTQSIEGMAKTKQKISSKLKINRLPLSIKIDVDNKTKHWAIGWMNRGSLPIGKQLMKGIRQAADLIFKDIQADDSSNYDAILKIELVEFNCCKENFTLSTPPYGAVEYTMSMAVKSKLAKKDGSTIYRKTLNVEHDGFGEYIWDGNVGGSQISEGNAMLVGLWVRDFAKDITQDLEVQKFAQSIAGTVQVAEVSGPEIIITSLANGSSTDQAGVQLIGSISSNSPIKEISTSINGHPLKQTRGLLIASKKTGIIKLDRRIPLSMRENVISITATNEAGGTSQKIVSIIRTKPALITAADVGSGSKIGERWAVVIGISRYKHSAKGIPDLNNAANDALTFADFLKSPQGGGFKNENVLLLTNEQATSAALRRALFTFLKKAIEEDLVIFFFSGQGAPEPGTPENYYLLTYDANPVDLPSTSIAVWDVDTAFRRNIKAKRAVIITDASHVSSIGKSTGTRSVGGSNLINKYLKKLSESGEGKAIFSATQEGEVGAKIRGTGKKTRLFTHYLLEALSGAGDANNDGIVSLGEAIDYTTDLVSAASRGKQRPDIAGKFDRNLPLAVLK